MVGDGLEVDIDDVRLGSAVSDVIVGVCVVLALLALGLALIPTR